MNISKSGLINTKKGYWNYGPTFIKPDSASRDLIIKQSWNKTFASIVGYDDPVGIGDSSPISNNSQVSFPIAGSGNYRTYVGGNDQVNIDYISVSSPKPIFRFLFQRTGTLVQFHILKTGLMHATI